LRKGMLLLLCGMLLGGRSTASELKSLPRGLEHAYGIELDRCYPGVRVLEVLEAIEEEVAAAVQEAYAEGYKAGRVEAVELWKPVVRREQERANRAEQALAEAERKGMYGVLVGVLMGMVSAWVSIQLVGR